MSRVDALRERSRVQPSVALFKRVLALQRLQARWLLKRVGSKNGNWLQHAARGANVKPGSHAGGLDGGGNVRM